MTAAQAAHIRMLEQFRERERIRTHEHVPPANGSGCKRTPEEEEALARQIREADGHMTRRKMVEEFKCTNRTIRKILGPADYRGNQKRPCSP